jgi:excinuclease ABC subunit A
LPEAYVICEVCEGRRFCGDVLEIAWKGLSADRILALEVEQARPILAGHPRLEQVLRAMADVGLGYLVLGQPAHTLSGGEAQRLRLARELVRSSREGDAGTLVLLDDPTVGLHPADVAQLLTLLHRLTEGGATVWMATHDELLAASADVHIDLGVQGLE